MMSQQEAETSVLDEGSSVDACPLVMSGGTEEDCPDLVSGSSDELSDPESADYEDSEDRVEPGEQEDSSEINNVKCTENITSEEEAKDAEVNKADVDSSEEANGVDDGRVVDSNEFESVDTCKPSQEASGEDPSEAEDLSQDASGVPLIEDCKALESTALQTCSGDGHLEDSCGRTGSEIAAHQHSSTSASMAKWGSENNMNAVDTMVAEWSSFGMDWTRINIEVDKIRLQGIGAFILGLGSQYPDLWINALIDAGALESRIRCSSLQCLSYREVIMMEIFTSVFDSNRRVFFPQIPENAGLMKDLIGLVQAIEASCVENGKLCVDEALQLAARHPFMVEENERLQLFVQEARYKRFVDESINGVCTVNNKNMQMTALFFCKLVQSHVCYYGAKKKLLTCKIINRLNKADSPDPEKAKSMGDSYFLQGDFIQACEQYTLALKKDYASVVLYIKRAECNMKLNQYWEALSNCRRAIAVNTRSANGYTLAAEACIHLNDPWNEAQGFLQLARGRLMDFSGIEEEDLITVIELEEKIEDMNYKVVKLGLERSRRGVEVKRGTIDLPHRGCSCPLELLMERRARENSQHALPDGIAPGSQWVSLSALPVVPVPPATLAPPASQMPPAVPALLAAPAPPAAPAKTTALTTAASCVPPALAVPSVGVQGTVDSKQSAEQGKGRNRVHAEQQRTAVSTMLSLERSDVDKFQLNLEEGLEAFSLNNMLRAAGKYQAALTLWSHSADVKAFMDFSGVVVVRYVFGITAACVDTSLTEFKSLVLEALHTFQMMHREQVHRSFPLMLYGLTRCLIALYRFPEALGVVDREISQVRRKEWKTVCWPLTDQVIRESHWEVFQEEVKALKGICRFPPKPDAVCWEHEDTEEGRQIYRDSCTYSGMVSMHCYQDCCFRFHLGCWKAYKTRLSVDKISDKEMVDRECPTPDCGSFINYISIHKPSKKMVEISSDHHPVKVPRTADKSERMKPCERTLDHRREKKEAARQRKAAACQADSLLEESQSYVWATVNNEQHTMQETIQKPSTLPSAESMVLLMKEKEREEGGGLRYNMFQKAVKQKRKKEKKEKAVVNVEVNFSDNPDRERVGTYDLDAEEQMTSDLESSEALCRMAVEKAPLLPTPLLHTPLPPQPRRTLESFSQVVASTPAQNPVLCKSDEDTKKTLTRLLHDILAEQGPQLMSSLLQLEVVKDIGEDAGRVLKHCGGLPSFLLNNPKFVIINNYVAIRQDANKLQQLSDGQASLHPFSTNSRVPNSNNSNSIVDGARTRKMMWEDIAVMAGTNPEYCSEGIEMTESMVRKGLNPTAPEFQPLKGPRMNDIDEIELGTTTRMVMDALDTFEASEDTDPEDMHDIDEVDLEPVVGGANMEEGVTMRSVHDGNSQLSSQSDLSQAGSDLSTGMLFRTASPSSVSSSYRSSSNNNTRDVSSPLSTHDANSPAMGVAAARVPGEITVRQTGSPVGSGLGLDRGISRFNTPPLSSSFLHPSSSSSSLNADFAGEATGCLFSVNDSVYLPPQRLPPVPKPLRPLAPLGGSASASRLASGSVGRSVSERTANTPPPPGVVLLSSPNLHSVSVELPSSFTSLSSSLSVTSPLFTPADGTTSIATSSFSVSPFPLSSLSLPSVQTGSESPFASALKKKEPGHLTASIAAATTRISPSGSMQSREDRAQAAQSYDAVYTPSFIATGVKSSSSLLLPHSNVQLSAFADRFKHSTQSFIPAAASSSDLGELTSTSSFSHLLPSFPSSDPWSVSTTATSGQSGEDKDDGGWMFGKSNIFPSAIRPDELTTSTAMSAFTPATTTTFTTSTPFPHTRFPHFTTTWSMDKGEGVGVGGGEDRGTAVKKVDAEVQTRVETTSKEVTTDISGHEFINMKATKDALIDMHNISLQLRCQLEQTQQKLFRSQEENQVMMREAEERQAILNKAMHQIATMETSSTRVKEEYSMREQQLLSELQALQDKCIVANKEASSLLQRVAALENRSAQAEVRVVMEQMENFKITLNCKLHEVERQRHDFLASIPLWQKANQGQAVPQQQVMEVEHYFKHLSDSIRNTLDRVLTQLYDQRKQIMSGKILSELEPITKTTPQMLPVPDALKILPTGQASFCPTLSWQTTVTSAASGTNHPPRVYLPLQTTTAVRPTSDPTSQAPAPLRPLGIPRPAGMSSSAVPPSSSSLSSMAQGKAVTATGVPTSKVSPVPPPLRPLGSVGRGLLSRTAPPLAANKPGQVSDSSVSMPKQSSFERLVTILQTSFPTIDREVLQQCLQKMRQDMKGSLSGLDMQYIVRCVTQMLMAQGHRPHRNSMRNGTFSTTTTTTTTTTMSTNSNGWGGGGSEEVTGKRTAPPPGISPTWSVEGLEPVSSDLFVEEEDPCAICTEELSTDRVQDLDCGHRFHDHCIRTWFKQQTTCPKCRSHAPLHEDYPPLK